MRTIGHEELKQKLDRQDDFRLVMALAEWARPAQAYPGFHPFRHDAGGAAFSQQRGRDCCVLFRCQLHRQSSPRPTP